MPSASSKSSRPTSKKMSSLALRPGNGCPAPAAPARTPGSTCAKADGAHDSVVRAKIAPISFELFTVSSLDERPRTEGCACASREMGRLV